MVTGRYGVPLLGLAKSIYYILYIEMPACDVVEPKAPCTLANFPWQTLIARVDEKILFCYKCL